jgi:cytochrome c
MTYFAMKLSALEKRILSPSLAHLLLVMALSAVPPFLGLTTGIGAMAEDSSSSAEYDKQLFTKRCGGCHSLDHDQTGPRLGNVYGRKAGTVSTFRYSDAMKTTQITWNDASLDKWLTDPESVVPDTDMEFHVPKPDERAAIIRCLRLSSGK